jgi:hypothetical protein
LKRPTLPDEAGVYRGAFGFRDRDASGVRVKRVEQIVECIGEDGGRDSGERRAFRFEPFVADSAGEGQIGLPGVAGRYPELGDAEFIGSSNAQQPVGRREFGLVEFEVNKDFYESAGRGFGEIDDGGAGAVPAGSVSATTFAAERFMPA